MSQSDYDQLVCSLKAKDHKIDQLHAQCQTLAKLVKQCLPANLDTTNMDLAALEALVDSKQLDMSEPLSPMPRQNDASNEDMRLEESAK